MFFFPSQTVELDIVDNSVLVYGAELHYLEAGKGSMLILLHGLGGNAWEWSSAIASLAEDFYVIALDQIGFGDSEKPFLNYRINTLVDFLHGFYRVLGINKASLIGHDLGGWTAATLALKYPDLIENLVLVATNPFNTANQKGLKTFSRPATCQQTLEHLQQLFYHQDRFVNWQVAERFFTQKNTINDGYTTQQLARSIYQNEDVLDNYLGELTTPTLIIQGNEDKFVPLTVSHRLHQEIKNSRLKILNRCGHLPHVEQPEAFTEIVHSFLGCRSSPNC
ncbi:MAG: alpha/beta hydrolase [Pleurocapsa sp. MO_192.B19]|nr:alpha/beta hydrolase [Pleurocapsa sp. MO_192.B19]